MAELELLVDRSTDHNPRLATRSESKVLLPMDFSYQSQLFLFIESHIIPPILDECREDNESNQCMTFMLMIHILVDTQQHLQTGMCSITISWIKKNPERPFSRGVMALVNPSPTYRPGVCSIGSTIALGILYYASDFCHFLARSHRFCNSLV